MTTRARPSTAVRPVHLALVPQKPVLPLDSVLMYLGRAYARAGKKEEAVRSFTRCWSLVSMRMFSRRQRRSLSSRGSASI